MYIRRREETTKNIIVLLIGIICLGLVTMNLINSKGSKEVVELEQILPHSVDAEESHIQFKIEEVYQSDKQIVNKEDIEKIITKVLGTSYLPEIQIEGKKGFYGVVITYNETNQEPNISKRKREQVALIDACLLMHLFDEVDVVTVKYTQSKMNEQRILYRLDLEDYFKISFRNYPEQKMFSKLIEEFLNSDKVSEYWSMKHPFDSSLNEEVEKFYKCNFPTQWDTLEEGLTYIDEDLGRVLNQQYGYKFWIQGLKYDHPIMNYYAAYQLIQYYGDNNLDEILLELASCKIRTKNLQVKQACDFIMNVLSKALEPDKCVIFTTYNELIMQEREQLYGIVDNQLIQVATWQGEGQAGFEVVSLSSDKRSVLCKLHTFNGEYLYVIPIDTVGGYQVNETVVQREEVIYSRELMNLIKEVVLNEEMGDEVMREIDEGKLQSRWLFKDVLLLSVSAEESFVYDGKQNSLCSETFFNQGFDAEYLLEGLKERFIDLEEKEVDALSNECRIQEITIGTEKIWVYEYESKRQKNIALLKEKQEIKPLQTRWSKGKIYVIYEGRDRELIKILDLLMME